MPKYGVSMELMQAMVTDSVVEMVFSGPNKIDLSYGIGLWKGKHVLSNTFLYNLDTVLNSLEFKSIS